MNKFKRILSIIVICFILFSVFPNTRVFAAPSSSMSISGSTEVGSIITVSVRLNSGGLIGGYNGSFSYESEYFQLQSITIGAYTSDNFSTDSQYFTDYGFSISSGTTVVRAKFKCMKVGTKSIGCYFDDVGDDVGTPLGSTSCSASVTIVTPVPKSSNANLSSLTVSPGSFSPSFSKTNRSYSMTVGEDQTKITVSAVPEDSKATVTLNGVQKNLKPGDNTVKITVKAEDGTTKVYSIVVTRQSGPTGTPTPTPKPLPLMVYGDEELMILPIDENTTVPEGYTASTATYKGVEIPVFKGPAQPGSTVEILLVQLLTEEEVRYFVYNSLNQSVYPLLFVKQPEASLQIVSAGDTVELPIGYEAFPFVFEEEEVTAYRLISDPTNPQILLYVMDAGGQEAFYYYDTEKRMLLPYRGETVLVEPTPTLTPSPDPAESTSTATDSEPVIATEQSVVPDQSKSVIESLTDLKNPFTIMFYLVGLIAIVLAVAVVVLMLGRKSEYGGDYEDEYLPDEEPLPPLAVYPKANRKQQTIDPDDVFEERTGSVEPSHTDNSYIPSIVRLAPQNIQSGPPSNTMVQTGPVADTTPVMGVRAIHMDNIPELFEKQMPADKPTEASSLVGRAPIEHGRTVQASSILPKPAVPVQTSPVFPGSNTPSQPSSIPPKPVDPTQNSPVNRDASVQQNIEEHIPVRLKQELDAEKAKTVFSQTPERAPAPILSTPATPKPKNEIPPLDFPDLTKPPAAMDPDLE